MSEVRKPIVLMVDDNQDTLNFVKDGHDFIKPNFELLTAKNGQEAVTLLNTKVIDAVVLDVALPDMTGAWLGDVIRKENPTIRIAFLTNYGGPTTRGNAEDIGAEFWFKPDVMIDFDTIINCICELVSGTDCSEEDDAEVVKKREKNYTLPNAFMKMTALV